MSVDLVNLYARQYATNVELLLQQAGSRLRGCVTEGSYVGDQASPVDQLGAVEMQEVTSRFAAMGRVDADTDRRWLFPTSYDLPQLIDKFDLVKMIVDPKSKYVQNAVNAAGRRIDRTIISAFFGTAKTGVQGATSTTFPAGQIVAVDHDAAGDTGLTVAKLREARRLFMAADLDMETEELFCGVTSQAHNNLLGEAQVVSLDYNERPVLVDGKIHKFLGFTFKHSELFGESLSGGDQQIPCWAKSGMHLGVWQDMRTDVDQRKDLQGLPWQIYLWLTIAATRIEEEKIVKILVNI
jgi:hypothetical protein